MAYIGNTATTQAFTPAVDYFNGDGSTVAFTLSKPVASVAQVQAVIENVPQNPGSAYTVSGNTITFTSAPPSGTSNIYVYYTSPITQVIAPSQGTVGTSQLAGGTVNTSADATLNGVTVGKGAGSVSTNTAVGASALTSNTTGPYNTAVGYQAGYSNTTGQLQTCLGYQAGYGSTGSSNTFVGNQAGVSMTSGSKNTILGAYNGNQGGLDIRTSSNNIVLSDGDGNPRMRADSTGQFYSLITGVGLYADYGCRAWVNFNGTGTVAIRASGNVSSITDNGTGDYTVNFTTAMPDTNYSYIVSGKEDESNNSAFAAVANPARYAQTTSSFRVVTRVPGGSAYDFILVSAAVFR